MLAEGSNPAGTVGYTGANVGEIIERVETRIDKFAKAFKNTLDDSVDPDRQLLESSEGLEKAFDKVNGKFEAGDAIVLAWTRRSLPPPGSTAKYKTAISQPKSSRTGKKCGPASTS